MANANPRWLLANEPEPEVHAPADQRWMCLVRTLLRIRRLQRIWGTLGGVLQTVNSDLRRRLQTSITNAK